MKVSLTNKTQIPLEVSVLVNGQCAELVGTENIEVIVLPTSADWTSFRGKSNCSEKFLELVKAVGYLIRDSAHQLIGGKSDEVAGLIIAQLAHRHGLVPLKLNVEDECPFENGLCPDCNQKLKPCPSGWVCSNGHGW